MKIISPSFEILTPLDGQAKLKEAIAQLDQKKTE